MRALCLKTRREAIVLRSVAVARLVYQRQPSAVAGPLQYLSGVHALPVFHVVAKAQVVRSSAQCHPRPDPTHTGWTGVVRDPIRYRRSLIVRLAESSSQVNRSHP
jgi:hypothetical protein